MLTIMFFELRQKFRSISTYVYFLMFFALAMLWMAAAGGAFAGATISFGGKTHINAPSSVSQTITFLGYLGIVIVAAMMGRAIQQDTEHNIWHFFYTSPINKFQYLAGRFLGAFFTLLFIFSSVGLGAWLGCYLPGIEPVHLGPIMPLSYILPYLFSLIPNLLIFGALFFTMGALFRRMLPVYVASVVLLIGYLASGPLLHDLDNKTLAALMDPFGSRAISLLTEYWSVADKNTKLVPLSGIYLTNRLIWSAFGFIMILTCFWRFNFAAISSTGRQKKERQAPAITSKRVTTAHTNFSTSGLLRMFIAQTNLNLRETIKNIYFIAIALCGVLFMASTAPVITKMFGTSTYPVTYAVLEVLSGTFSLFMLIITTFYAGELVWRERDARMSQLFDTLPIPNSLPFLSKLLSLILLQGLLLFVLMIFGILFQTIKGYHHYELAEYSYQLFLVQWPDYMLIAVLAMAIQIIINNKYVGYFLMIAYYIAQVSLPGLGFEHPMLVYGDVPRLTYSAINGYGHFLPEIRWTQTYWSGIALILVSASMLFWVRGTTSDWRGRLRLAKLNTSRSITIIAAMGLLCFASAGCALFYFNNILNTYKNTFDKQSEQATYETKYKQFERAPQPRITDVKLNVDIFPNVRRANISGEYVLTNRSSTSIQKIFITEDTDMGINHFIFDRESNADIQDKQLGFYSFTLKQALQSGETLKLHFDLSVDPKTFLGMSKNGTVLFNGTFFNSGLMPHIGYQSHIEITEDKDRRKHGLKEKERMASRDDIKALQNNYISNDADLINFDATVSTSADQMAIAPGKFDREWSKDGRRYFHYTLDKPIWNFYSFQSGKFDVKTAKWNDVDIEIDYQHGHEYNLDRMIKGVQESLDYYTKNFSPYQHKMVRIIEFPRYQSFAQAFPNTIPFSESIGFIAKVDDKDPKDIDYPFYVTAHEVAHQWWAHQVLAGNSQGETVLSETLAQYSALMVMKHHYGEAKMRRFLKFELDRYLMGRGQERKKELPLALNENQQYLHYAKGSLVMYLLQDQIGEDKINQALHEVVMQYAYKGPPYPTSRVLVDAIRKVTPADKQGLIDDLFNSIILFENRALSASAKPLGKGTYEVNVEVAAAKFKADELGAEKEVLLHEWIDIGVDDKDGNSLIRERHYIDRKIMTFKLLVHGEPAKAGIDPDNKYIDRTPDDNLIKVDMNDAKS